MLTRPGVTTAPFRSTRASASGSAPPPTAAIVEPSTSSQPLSCSVPASSIVTMTPFAVERRRHALPGCDSRSPGLGLADEARLLPELGDRGGVDVAHAAAQAAVQLLDDLGHRAAERELHLLALGDVLVERVAAALDREAGGRRRARGHAAVDLEQLAAPADDVAGALLAAGEQAADHDRARAGADRGRDVAGAADAAVGDQRHAGLAGGVGAVEHRRQLRHADARDEPRRAREARADPDLDRVRTGGGEVDDAVAGRDVAGHDLDVGPRAPSAPATASIAASAWPWAMSSTSASTSASISASARTR